MDVLPVHESAVPPLAPLAIEWGASMAVASRYAAEASYGAAVHGGGLVAVVEALGFLFWERYRTTEAPIRVDEAAVRAAVIRARREVRPDPDDDARLAHSLAQLVLARAQLVEGELASARSAVDEAMSLLGSAPPATTQLVELAEAFVSSEQGEGDRALEALRRAVGIDSGDPASDAEARGQLATALVAMARLGEPEAVLDDVAALEGKKGG